jgi:hypothetical protein
LVKELRRVTFRYFPDRIPAARLLEQVDADGARLESEPGIEIGLRRVGAFKPSRTRRILLAARNADEPLPIPAWLDRLHDAGDEVYLCDPRGVGRTRWTRKNPPNYVQRAHALLGRTVDTGRVWDIAAAARYLHAAGHGQTPVFVAGEGPAGVLAAYAALWEPEIAGAILSRPPPSHADDGAPPLLNVLRVCDISDVLGMLAPRPLQIETARGQGWDKVGAIYAAAGQADKLKRTSTVAEKQEK